jgi:hypothetical protein
MKPWIALLGMLTLITACGGKEATDAEPAPQALVCDRELVSLTVTVHRFRPFFFPAFMRAFVFDESGNYQELQVTGETAGGSNDEDSISFEGSVKKGGTYELALVYDRFLRDWGVAVPFAEAQCGYNTTYNWTTGETSTGL